MSAMFAALIMASAAAGPQTLELSRGCTIREATGTESRYWSATDTSIDSHEPDVANGGGRTLTSGPGQIILIKFGDLESAIGPDKKVVKATLVLTVDAGTPKLRSVAEVLVPWGEGPCHTLVPPPLAPGAKPTPPRWAATWRHRRAGESAISWQQPGAQGAADSKPLTAARAGDATGATFAIEGLEDAVQRQYERWYDNHGFALSFETSVTFFSSKSVKGRPKLELELEDAAPKTGPDLSVTYIERTPEYERYDNRDAYTFKDQGGQSVGVMNKPGAAQSQKWPKDGETVTYTAHVKNVGDAPSQGFGAQWIVREVPGSVVDVDKGLKPGEETTVVYTKPYKADKLDKPDTIDHRVLPIGFKIIPKGPDAVAANDYVEIQENALNMGIWVEKSFYDMMAEKPNIVGSHAFEDWLQAQFRIWNEAYFPFSRFSFAPDGILERVRIQRITIVPDGTLKGGAHMPGDKPTLVYDGEWGFEGPKTDAGRAEVQKYIDSVRQGKDAVLLRDMSRQIGLIDLTAMEVDPGLPDGSRGKVHLRENGSVVTRGAMDRFPGLMGGGDTRNESMLPGRLTIPQDPVDDPVLDGAELEATDLYSASDVAGLNGSIGYRRGYSGEFIYDQPQLVLFHAVDVAGRAISGAELSFFQMANGQIADGPPAFTLTADKFGVAILPERPTLETGTFTTLTGHTLKPNAFGRLDVAGANGAFMVRCKKNGATDWGWLKAWQLVDALHRGQKAPFVDVRFQVPSQALDLGVNLAKDRIVVDSADSAPAKLSPLLDGTFSTTVQFGQKAGDWVEIDLGRDRPIGEVRLYARSAEFWNKFDVMIYSTGQKVEDAILWAHEPDWRYSATNRRDVDPKDFGLFSVAYRSQAQRIRFIRIVCREATKSAGLVGITVTPVQPTP